MAKPGYWKQLSVLHAVLTAAAALTILILSVTPSFSLSSAGPAGTALTPHIIACGILGLVLLICVSFVCMMQLYRPGSRGKLAVLHASLTVTLAIIILGLSVMPPLSLGSSGVVANSGALLHIVAYGTLCFLICMWLRVDGSVQSPLLGAFFFSSLYGVLVEFIQLGLPYRSFEMLDIMVNCCAAAVAVVPCYAVMRYVPLYKKTNMEEEVTFR